MSREALNEHIARHTLNHPPRPSVSSEIAWDDDDDDDGDGEDDARTARPTSRGAADDARLVDADEDRTTIAAPVDDPAACAPPARSELVKEGFRWNAWKYAPGRLPPAADADGSSTSANAAGRSRARAPVMYSVGVGRDLTFDAAFLARRPDAEVHAFDATPVAAEFVKALGAAGGVPANWKWHELLLAPKDATHVTLELPEGRADSFAPVVEGGEAGGERDEARPARDGEGAAGEEEEGRKEVRAARLSFAEATRFPARPLWRITARLGHEALDVLKLDVEGAEFETLGAMEAYYGAEGPPACQLLVEWHERFRPDGAAARAEAEAALTRMGFREVECWTGDECAYWSCRRCGNR
jgi:hypothetical protein